MERREFMKQGVMAVVATSAATDAALAAATSAPPPPVESPDEPGQQAATRGGAMIAVMAELVFAPDDEAAASAALADLAAATRGEPGCRRYVVGRDVSQPGHFHLSELWDDLAALAAHFRTPHMATFSAIARGLGYSAPFMKRIEIGDLRDLDVRALARG